MLKQSLQLKLSQKLSPQQIQLMKLIQLPTLAFEQRLKEELIENPALETGKESDSNTSEDEFSQDDYEEFDNSHIEADDINIDEYLSDDETPDYKLQANNYSKDDEDYQAPIVASESFLQDLLNQLNTFILSDQDRIIAQFLVGSIDDMGYLRRDLQDLVDDLAFTQGIYTDEQTIGRILNIIHQLEPAGVGARDLQECLLLQLQNKTTSEQIELAIDIIENSFDAFTKKHYDKLLQKYAISKEQLRHAIDEIEKLNPKPGSAYSENTRMVEHIIPDFTIKIVENELELTLNGRNAPELHVSKEYQEMLQTYKESNLSSTDQKNAVQFIKQKLDGAKWFIDAIKQRQETLFYTMHAIMEYQKDYFLTGDETKLRPMILKDIADIIGLDISTISRVANSKYVETPYGAKLIKNFFSEAMINDQGEEVSTIEIKKILQNIIAEEDKSKPLPDDKLAELLKEKGYPIARRTVAKYREQLDIPVARMRKRI
ncbi:RNA polymerase factor sigma-54 [Myroides sp. LJL110]